MNNFSVKIQVEELQSCARAAAENSAGLVMLLIDKGVFTLDELNSSVAKASSMLDQDIAETMDDIKDKFSKLSPDDKLRVLKGKDSFRSLLDSDSESS